MTDRERARALLAQIDQVFGGLADARLRELIEIRDRNQNPRFGDAGWQASSGFDEASWTALAEAVRDLIDLTQTIARVMEKL